MPRICQSSGKHTSAGREYTTRGLAKSKGGIGLKTTGVNKRTFKPNLQRLRIQLPSGEIRTIRVAASEIRSGKVTLGVRGKKQTVPVVKAPRGLQKRLRLAAAEKRAAEMKK